MRIDLVFPAFPPALDGIGDYTYHLATTLGRHYDVRVLTAQPVPADCPSARVCTAFSGRSPADIRQIEEAVALDPPTWLVVQYNPFSYGHWGFNPYLASTLRTLRRHHPEMKVAAVIHEPYVPIETWKFAVMWTWQRWQFRRLGATADVLFFPLRSWADRFGPWFPRAETQVLPVGSNIPRLPATREETRRDLGLDGRLVIGVFGTAHPSRQLTSVRTALDRLRAAGESPVVLYVGPAGTAVRTVLHGHEILDAGPLPGSDVSRHFSAMDVYLSPFEKGVSARRGSFLVGIQHGVATVSTVGEDTDALFRTDDTGVLLAPDDDPSVFADHVELLARDRAERTRRAAQGAAFYERNFSWSLIGARMGQALEAPTPTSSLSPSPL